MQHFREFRTIFDEREPACKRMKWQEYYLRLALQPPASLGDRLHSQWETEWYVLGKPYYRIYPSILPLFDNLRLNVPCDQIRPPLSAIAIQLPDGKVRDGEWVVDNLFVYWKGTQVGIISHGRQRGENILEMTAFPVTHNTVERELAVALDRPMFGSIPGKSPMSPELNSWCVRIVVTLCLIADNPEIVRPEVLGRDEEMYEKTGDEKYVERAKRNHRFGFTVGKHVEMSPHFRNGCEATYWTGRGRTVRTLRWRKECIVHKEVVQSVPQGWLDSTTGAQTEATVE